MRDITEESISDAVVASMTQAKDPRLRRLLERLVIHLHAFIRETEPTSEEWLAALQFLSEVGQKCDVVSAVGHQRVVTELFEEGDPYLGSDAVFGVKGSLVVPYRRVEGGPDGPRDVLEHEFRLEPVASLELPSRRGSLPAASV